MNNNINLQNHLCPSNMKSVLLIKVLYKFAAIDFQLAVQRSLCHPFLQTSFEVILRITLHLYFEKPFWYKQSTCM